MRDLFALRHAMLLAKRSVSIQTARNSINLEKWWTSLTSEPLKASEAYFCIPVPLRYIEFKLRSFAHTLLCLPVNSATRMGGKSSKSSKTQQGELALCLGVPLSDAEHDYKTDSLRLCRHAGHGLNHGKSTTFYRWSAPGCQDYLNQSMCMVFLLHGLKDSHYACVQYGVPYPKDILTVAQLLCSQNEFMCQLLSLPGFICNTSMYWVSFFM